MSSGPQSLPAPPVFRLMLYSRPLHPGLFSLQKRRVDHHDKYEVELWITREGHLVRFQLGRQMLTESVIDTGDHLPEKGLVHALPCIGEKEYELEQNGRLKYISTIQTETLADNLFMATRREVQDMARETGSLAYESDSENAALYLSVLSTQRYKCEFHVQSYHLLWATGLVLRSQSVFEVAINSST